ncbi:putative glutathione peroxidase 8 [Poecilia latipinna]|uniref:Glutathione peroxidase n=3 Tax=Poecilia TaxID=8080 RepID=A0A087Y1A8_POEFO|nr:PREDICTED: probable glutathione peroxidase 8 [Poecilia formosa]XP_014856093.1 PREDICTED: probable glutathione peroxidase 8 [Poecilia mexicana]XP_014875027.1 PREDICTED: probable glutathione peroxidase 8 [Poecilia latipinna]
MEALGGYPTKSSKARIKRLRVLVSMTVGVGCLFLLQTHLVKPRKQKDFYSFEVKDARGRTVSLEKYRGKASLVVNVASHCQHTEASYKSLQELHRELGTSHFNVLAFPCGQFGDTEPGFSRDIEAFAKSTYGVTFPFFSKIKILGTEAEPAFRFLTDSVQKIPKWNFWKFLVNQEGKVIRFWRTDESMESVRKEVTALVREIIIRKRGEL